MQVTKNDTIAIVITVSLHALILLALLFAMLSIHVPDPPLGGGGMEIDFGYSPDGSGTDLMALPTGPVVSQNPSVTPAPVKASTQTPEEVMTSEKGEGVVTIPKPDKKPVQETVKPVEKPKPQINQGALMPGQKSTGGQGSGNTPGNQGSLDGIPNGGRGGSGNNPNGTGNGTGIGNGNGPGRSPQNTSYKMDGRTLASSPPGFTYNEQEDGQVVVKVTVDRNGRVTNATTDGVKGSTTTNKTLHALAIENAKKWKWSVKADAPPEQIGFVTFVFNRN